MGDKTKGRIADVLERVRIKLGYDRLTPTPLIGSAGEPRLVDAQRYQLVEINPKTAVVYYRPERFQRIDGLILDLADEAGVGYHPQTVGGTKELCIPLGRPCDLIALASKERIADTLTYVIGSVQLLRLCHPEDMDDLTINRLPDSRFGDRRVLFDSTGYAEKSITVKDCVHLDINSQTGYCLGTIVGDGQRFSVATLKVQLLNVNGSALHF